MKAVSYTHLDVYKRQSYLVRVNISHAIIPIAEEYSLNEVQQGMLLSAFAWGYVALMFIGGILVDKFGALKMSFRSAIAWSVCTAVSSVGFCWPMIFSSELLAGASEAPIFPANAKIVRNNFEENERGRATAIFDSGSYAVSYTHLDVYKRQARCYSVY